MSKLSREQVLKLARLSRLQLSEEEIVRYQKELSNILDYIERLDQVDVTGLQPTYQVTGLKNQMREDVSPQKIINPDKLLECLPSRDGRYIKVGRMI